MIRFIIGNRFSIFIIFLFFISVYKNSIAQTDNHTTILGANLIINDDIDSTRLSAIINSDSANYLNINKFKYGGDRRYTMDGSMPLQNDKIKPVTASIFGSVFLTSIVTLHIVQANAWWKDKRGPFHFYEDWAYAKQVDKCGHAFGGYLTSYAMSEMMMASGFSWDNASNWGSAFGALYQTYVEFEDGFSTEWGFSPSDWYFDMLGPIFFLAQHYVPDLQNVTPKWTYIPNTWTGKPSITRPKTFIDDYNSSNFWYSINIYNILPKEYKKYWTPFFNIALGYGVDGIDANDAGGPPDKFAGRKYMIGLDYNLVALLPDGGWFWNWIRQSLNFFKLPAPALEFTKSGTRFYLMYPFNFKIGKTRF